MGRLVAASSSFNISGEGKQATLSPLTKKVISCLAFASFDGFVVDFFCFQ